MRQKSIGEVLRSARESRGWSLSEIQRMTNIQTKYVQALEYNDFEAIPDQTYTRSFLQRYAEVLDLNASILLDAYDTNSLVVYYDEMDEEVDSDLELRRHVKKKKAKNSYLPLIYLLLAATFIFIFVAYIVASRIQNQAATPSSSTSYSVVSETSESTTSSTQETAPSSTVASSTDTSSPKLTATGSGSNLAVTVSGAQHPVEVKLSVTTTTSWVSLTDTDIASGVVLSPENTSVTATIPEGVTTSTLTLGVVQGVTVTIAGQNLDTSALTSQTGYITLTIE